MLFDLSRRVPHAQHAMPKPRPNAKINDNTSMLQPCLFFVKLNMSLSCVSLMFLMTLRTLLTPDTNRAMMAPMIMAMILPLPSLLLEECLDPDDSRAGSTGFSTMNAAIVAAIPRTTSSAMKSPLRYGRPHTTLPVSPLTRIVLCLPLYGNVMNHAGSIA